MVLGGFRSFHVLVTTADDDDGDDVVDDNTPAEFS